MKLAIVGSRKINDFLIDKYVPQGVTEIVSGGAVGIDTLAREYAIKNNIKFVEFMPEYNLFGRAAPIKRNVKIAEYADEVLAFWDGSSKGTMHTISLFQKLGKKITVIEIKNDLLKSAP